MGRCEIGVAGRGRYVFLLSVGGLQPHLVVYARKAQGTADRGELDGVLHAVYLV